MELTLAHIKNTLAVLKPALHERFGVSEIGVFGSWVRGEQRPDSDIDLLVEFDRPVGLFDIMALEDYLQNVFGHKVDIAVRRSLRQYIGQYILREVEYV